METAPSHKYHQAAIVNLALPFRNFDWKFSGYQSAIRGIVPEEEIDDLARIVPDAFFVDSEERCLVALEVVDTHEVTNAKASHYFEHSQALGEVDWSLLVILFYPKTQQTFGIENWFKMLVLAGRDFSTRPQPWRDAFRVLKQSIA